MIPCVPIPGVLQGDDRSTRVYRDDQSTKTGKRTAVLRGFASNLLNPNEKRIIRKFLLMHEPEKLVNRIARFPGGKFIITGYGSFGGTTLIRDICESFRSKLQESYLGKAANLLIISLDNAYNEEYDRQSVTIFKAFVRQPDQKDVCIAQLTTSPLSETPQTYPLKDFLIALDDILANRKIKSKIHSLIGEHISKQVLLSRIVLLVDKLFHYSTLSLFENSPLFERKDVTHLIILEKEHYNRWRQQDRRRLESQGKFQIWSVPCLWESDYGIVNLIFESSLQTKFQENDFETRSYYQAFKSHLAFVGRGQLGTIIKELFKLDYWYFPEDGEPYIDLDKLDIELIQHNAWLQDLLDKNWSRILQAYFIDGGGTDRAKQGVYSLVNWIIQMGTFTIDEILAEAEPVDAPSLSVPT